MDIMLDRFDKGAEMSESELDHIFVRDAEARAMLGEIADFDARKTGKANLTASLHRVLVEEVERMKSTTEYKRWKKERGQAT